jgi:glucose/arabinose dehydrogenase
VRRLGFAAIAFAVIAAAAIGIASRGAAALPTVPSAFTLTVIAHVPRARELAFAPNGDLFAGTLGDAVYVIPNADGQPGEPRAFVHIDDAPVAGLTFADGALIVGGQFGVWRIRYRAGDVAANGAPVRIASVRTSGAASDHHTTSVAVSHGRLYVSVGSSCDACDPELDATRATIQQLELPDGSLHPKAVHVRNAIALTVNAATGSVWAGVAGQDALEFGHPYEIFDDVTAHDGIVDYGWPYCYENRKATASGHDCSKAAVPRVVFPAYDTPIGAAFYPADTGRYAFGDHYAGGAFVALHGSWHVPPVAPRVAFVPFAGDYPGTAIDWHDPSVQWTEFVGGFQRSLGRRIGRPTGVAVGPEGSLFVADDEAGVIYRIRPRSATR